jgi:hypothetical protein
VVDDVASIVYVYLLDGRHRRAELPFSSNNDSVLAMKFKQQVVDQATYVLGSNSIYACMDISQLGPANALRWNGVDGGYREFCIDGTPTAAAAAVAGRTNQWENPAFLAYAFVKGIDQQMMATVHQCRSVRCSTYPPLPVPKARYIRQRHVI